jgi:N-acetyl-anhydromuramyl-L-alanine amidase AmpD
MLLERAIMTNAYGVLAAVLALRAAAFGAGPDYAWAQWRPSPNFSARGGRITHVVIHTCETTYVQCRRWLRNPSSGVSAHYVVDGSGSEIAQLVRERDKAWHVATAYVNDFSIGIEHAGFAGQPTWSDGLLAASAHLVCDITRDHGIPRDRFHIVGHGQLQPDNRDDPGPTWPWPRYLDLVRRACD